MLATREKGPPMKPRAPILPIRPAEYETVELEPDDPQTAEVPATTVATDLCPSDHHAATGNIPIPLFPFWRRTRGAGMVPDEPISGSRCST